MDLELRNRVALVAASSSGLGRACAEALAAEGARVVVSSRNIDKAQAAADEIAERTKSETAAFACDLAHARRAGTARRSLRRQVWRLGCARDQRRRPAGGRFCGF